MLYVMPKDVSFKVEKKNLKAFKYYDVDCPITTIPYHNNIQLLKYREYMSCYDECGLIHTTRSHSIYYSYCNQEFSEVIFNEHIEHGWMNKFNCPA